MTHFVTPDLCETCHMLPALASVSHSDTLIRFCIIKLDVGDK